jgi:hypothetical protein
MIAVVRRGSQPFSLLELRYSSDMLDHERNPYQALGLLDVRVASYCSEVSL